MHSNAQWLLHGKCSTFNTESPIMCKTIHRDPSVSAPPSQDEEMLVRNGVMLLRNHDYLWDSDVASLGSQQV